MIFRSLKITRIHFLLLSFFSFQCFAAGQLTLSTEKTKISVENSITDCENSKIKPWSFENDKPIESPCKLIRTAPPIELGPKLLGLGKIEKGINLPTGAIWSPLYIY